MRYILIIISTILYTSCTELQAYTDQPKENINQSISSSKLRNIDELLNQSKQTRKLADSVSKMSDVATNKKVEEHIKVVTVLQYKVVELKQTNEVLKVQIDSLDNIGKYYHILPISYNEDHR